MIRVSNVSRVLVLSADDEECGKLLKNFFEKIDSSGVPEEMCSNESRILELPYFYDFAISFFPHKKTLHIKSPAAVEPIGIRPVRRITAKDSLAMGIAFNYKRE